MIRWPRHLLLTLAYLSTPARSLAAQKTASPDATMNPGANAAPPAATHADRRGRAYALLGANLLVIQSAWSQAAADQSGLGQDATFYYYTGLERLLGAVLVLDGGTRRAALFLPPPGLASPAERLLRDADESYRTAAALGVDSVAPWSAFAAYVDARVAARPGLTIHVDPGGVEAMLASRLGTPLDTMAAGANPHLGWLRALRRRWPAVAIVRDTSISPALRSVKDAGELAVLRRVGASSVVAFRAGLARFAPGRRQRDVEAAVVEVCTRLGDGPAFWPWAMAGPNAAFPTPFTSSLDSHSLDRVMQAGEVARFDIGCRADHYMGDVGRTVPVSGRFSPGQAEVVDLLAAVYQAGVATLRDGAPAAGLLRASVAEAARRRGAMKTPLGRHAAALLTEPDSLPFWQWHGIGLDYAEPLPAVLRAGMVLDYEPIFVVDGQGFYMEDMVVVTRDGYQNLTPGLPNTAAEIERAMRQVRGAR